MQVHIFFKRTKIKIACKKYRNSLKLKTLEITLRIIRYTKQIYILTVNNSNNVK